MTTVQTDTDGTEVTVTTDTDTDTDTGAAITTGAVAQTPHELLARLRRTLRVPLDDSAVVELATEAAELSKEIGSAVEYEAALRRAGKTRIEAMQDDLAELMSQIRDGVERVVDVEQWLDLDHNRVYLIRCDTRVVFDERAATSEDAQRSLLQAEREVDPGIERDLDRGLDRESDRDLKVEPEDLKVEPEDLKVEPEDLKVEPEPAASSLTVAEAIDKFNLTAAQHMLLRRLRGEIGELTTKGAGDAQGVWVAAHNKSARALVEHGLAHWVGDGFLCGVVDKSAALGRLLIESGFVHVNNDDVRAIADTMVAEGRAEWANPARTKLRRPRPTCAHHRCGRPAVVRQPSPTDGELEPRCGLHLDPDVPSSAIE